MKVDFLGNSGSLSPRGVSLLLYAVCGVAATLSLVVHYLSYAGSPWQSKKASVTVSQPAPGIEPRP
ncbi:MAG: hypothetical protein HYZ37_06300 [Candidatus Solibacter usitatus]|nr:hypothetical protein [Candidatus Solibacter usitatus]